MEGFPAERTQIFQAPIKLAQPFPAPELPANNFTDTRLFLIFNQRAFKCKFFRPERAKVFWGRGWGRSKCDPEVREPESLPTSVKNIFDTFRQLKGEVKRGEVVRECTGPEGERRGRNEGKRVGGKGSESTLQKENSDFSTPLI